MKKAKKNKLFKLIFFTFLLVFIIIYFSELTGYYEYQNHLRRDLTEEQIRKFEEDVKSGKEIDLDEYLIVDTTNYNNKLSDLASKMSDGISNIVESGVEKTFKLLSKLIEE